PGASVTGAGLDLGRGPPPRSAARLCARGATAVASARSVADMTQAGAQRPSAAPLPPEGWVDGRAGGDDVTPSRVAAAVWRRAWLVVLVAGVAALAGHAVALDHPRVHVAKALLLVGPLKAG